MKGDIRPSTFPLIIFVEIYNICYALKVRSQIYMTNLCLEELLFYLILDKENATETIMFFIVPIYIIYTNYIKYESYVKLKRSSFSSTNFLLAKNQRPSLSGNYLAGFVS
jgi:hypothetical protein